ncbi:MAG: hypothetical protein K2L84_05685 [Muribaculaceae bacterium]|nr:hypothetical protein [Muribaculaceae bacterium]
METLMNIGPGYAGWLVWIVWALIGAFEALAAQKCVGGKRVLLFDLTIGIVAAVIGGYLSICYVGSTPIQLFLISVLGAVFASFIGLWIVGGLLLYFTRKNGSD